MTLPFPVPDWLPWWAILAILVPLLVYLLAFLVMPFNVFGLRGRLDVIDARLDEIQGEIRALANRLPAAAARRADPAPDPPPARAPRRWSERDDAEADDDSHDIGPRSDRRPAPRAEPRLVWPR